MTEITVNSAAEIDGAQYFERLLRGMTDDAAGDIRAQLWMLLKRQTERYTMGDSSSVRAETAQALLRSVCWCIGTYLKRVPIDDAVRRLEREPVAALFEAGRKAVEEDVKRGRVLLRVLQAYLPGVTNRAYRDTVDGLPVFFRQYDAAFFADDIPGAMIDYPLCIPVPETGGITYINAYIRRLLMENAFCRAVDAAEIQRVLRAYGPDYDEQFVNIFEAVFTAGIGRALLGADVHWLDITAHDKAILLRMLGGLSAAALTGRVAQAADGIAAALGITDAALAGYMKAVGQQLIPRLLQQLESAIWTGCFYPSRTRIPLHPSRCLRTAC